MITVFERTESIITSRIVCFRILETEDHDEAIRVMIEMSREGRSCWVEPNGTIDTRFYVEIPKPKSECTMQRNETYCECDFTGQPVDSGAL